MSLDSLLGYVMNLDELKKIVPVLKESENSIIEAWIASHDFQAVLSEHIVPAYFKDNYAHAIFQYFIDVVEGRTEIGDCPSMRKFLNYCSLEGFKVGDVYKICANLRHAVSLLLIEKNLMDKTIYEQMNHILDQNLSGLLAMYNDMIEVKNLTIENQQQWLSQYEKVVDKILIVSKADIRGKIIYANDNFAKISGYSKSELIGQAHNIVRHEDMPKAVFKNLWETILAKKAWSGVMENRAKDGSIYYVSTIVFPILDANGNIIEFLSSRTDITELFTLQHEKEKREKLLMKQTSLAEMGDMISLIAHQWKQPLSTISAIISNMMIQEELGTSSDTLNKEECYKIQKIIKHMSETINDFRNFLKPDRVKNDVNSTDIVQSALTLIEAKLKHLNIDVKIHKEYTFNMKLFANDLKQVLLNLYMNAADVIEEKEIERGKLDISFEYDETIGKIIVADNGGGIPSSLLPDKLFNIYETTKGEKGTGIGLRLCKRIIEEEFYGKIYAENTKDGAKFTIELPLN